MAYMITDDCVRCQECEWACPTGAVIRSADNKRFTIDPARCTECVGDFDLPQCTLYCAADCCLPDPARKETGEQLLEKRRGLQVV